MGQALTTRLGPQLVEELVETGIDRRSLKKFFSDAMEASRAAYLAVPKRRRSAERWCALTLFVGSSAVLGAGIASSPTIGIVAAAVWLPWALLCCAFVLTHLGMIRDADGTPRQEFLIPNGLTLLRLTTAPLALEPIWRFEVGSPAAIVAAVWLASSLASDSVDGVLARALGQRSDLGKTLDPLADIAIFGFLAVGLNRAGLLPWYTLTLFLLRYPGALVGVIALYFIKGPIEVRPTVLGKTVTALSAILLTVSGAAGLIRPAWLEVDWIRFALAGLAVPLAANLVYLLVRAATWPRR